jgi:beta-lactam-binding protein with PASTA domain
MVDTLDPADKTNKVVSQAQAAWTSAGLTGTLTATPSTATNYVITQSRQAYTCVAPGSTATITTQVDQP